MPDCGYQGQAGRFRLARAATALKAGAIIGYPTEGVFGLGCDPWQPQAVARLLHLKRRPRHKGLILVAASSAQLGGLVTPGALEAKEVQQTWPGPVTWLLPALPGVPSWLTGARPSLAVRVTAHPIAAALSLAFGGPIVSTSANPTGQPPAHTALAVRLRFGRSLALTLPGATPRHARPTEIRAFPDGQRVRAS